MLVTISGIFLATADQLIRIPLHPEVLTEPPQIPAAVPVVPAVLPEAAAEVATHRQEDFNV